MTQEQAEKKREIAINKMVDLQDGGFGCDAVQRVLDILNTMILEKTN